MSYVYEYDLAGNILSKYVFPWTGAPAGHNMAVYPAMGEKIKTYTYSTSAWGDLLTNYNGKSISYTAIGNPMSWRNAEGMSWNGRQLTDFVYSLDHGVSFSYNADGIRTGKTLYDDYEGTATQHAYLLDGTKILRETITNGSTTDTLYYYYDASGSVIGFEYKGSMYYYQKNIQGDVLRLINSGGGVAAQYTYDAWGKLLSVTDANGNAITSSTHVANLNPFRYRSYYYDTETGFYYLQTRYYDPEVGRFLNADGYISTGQGIIGNNMFAYCLNNPVNMVDYGGEFPIFNDIIDMMSKVVNTIKNEIKKAKELNPQAVANEINKEFNRLKVAVARKKYADVVRSFDVEHNYLPDEYGNTYCNYFARDVMKAMGAELPGGRVNSMYDALLGGYNGWEEVENENEAWQYANKGYPTIAIWKNNNGVHGHIQVVIPSDSIDTAVAQAGAKNYYGGPFMNPARYNGIKYYVNFNYGKGA